MLRDPWWAVHPLRCAPRVGESHSGPWALRPSQGHQRQLRQHSQRSHPCAFHVNGSDQGVQCPITSVWVGIPDVECLGFCLRVRDGESSRLKLVSAVNGSLRNRRLMDHAYSGCCARWANGLVVARRVRELTLIHTCDSRRGVRRRFPLSCAGYPVCRRTSTGYRATTRVVVSHDTTGQHRPTGSGSQAAWNRPPSPTFLLPW
jgi:hypothetical protein